MLSAPVMSCIQALSVKADKTMSVSWRRHGVTANSFGAKSAMHRPSSHASDQNNTEEPLPNPEKVDTLIILDRHCCLGLTLVYALQPEPTQLEGTTEQLEVQNA
jgi:hypothetical protein